MKLNLKDLKEKDITGKEIILKGGNTTLANIIYYGVKDIELAEKAMKLFKDQTIELTPEQVKTVKTLVNDEKSGLTPLFIRELNNILK